MTKEPDHIALRSDAVRDIIGKAPKWVVRWGSSIVALVIISLFALAAWIKYPNILNSQITLLSPQPPVRVVARNDGYIEHLLVRDSQEVVVGQTLAILESSVNYEFVLFLEPHLDSLENWISEDRIEAIEGFTQAAAPGPGFLKNEFTQLLSSLRSFLIFRQLDQYSQRIEAVQKEYRDISIHYERLYEQREIRQKDLNLATQQKNRHQSLFESGAVSTVQLEQSTQAYLDKKLRFEETRSALSAYQIEKDKIQQRLQDLQFRKEADELNLITAIQEKKTALTGAISEWRLNYSFQSPIVGVVTFNSFYSENQRVRQGDQLMTIIESNSDEVIGKMSLPAKGSGKAKEGQKVLVKMDNYPYLEYGMLVGVIDRISLVAAEDHMTVQVLFEKGMETSYGRIPELTQGMTGQAEVITDSQSLLYRLVSPIKYLISRGKEIREPSVSAE